MDDILYNVRMDFVKYTTGKWINPYRDKSGAYIFLPDGPSQVADDWIYL